VKGRKRTNCTRNFVTVIFTARHTYTVRIRKETTKYNAQVVIHVNASGIEEQMGNKKQK
jgi:hypothetical protein